MYFSVIFLSTYLTSHISQRHSFPTCIYGTFPYNISERVIFIPTYPRSLRLIFLACQSHLPYHIHRVVLLPTDLRVIFLVNSNSFFLPIYSLEGVISLPASFRDFLLFSYHGVVFLPVIVVPQCCFPSCHRRSVLFSFLSSYLSVIFLPVILPQCCFPSCHRTSVLFSLLSSYLSVIFLPVFLTQFCFPSCRRTSVLFSFLSSYLSVVSLPVILPQCCFPSCHLTSVLFSFLSSYLSVVFLPVILPQC
jgi:hypothetical protein